MTQSPRFPPRLSSCVSSGRFLRQDPMVPPERREGTAVALLNGRSDPESVRLMVMMAAAAGVRAIWSDFHGRCDRRGNHWSLRHHADMAGAINADASYEYLDGERPGDDLRAMLAENPHPALVLFANQPARGCALLRPLVHARMALPVILTLAGPGGLCVFGAECPDVALAYLEPVEHESPLPEAPWREIPMAAQAAALHEILTAPAGQLRTGIVARYSLQDPLRISESDEGGLVALYRELSRPAAGISFAGRTIVFMGAGGLGNWAPLAVVPDGILAAEIYDMDVFAESNLSRQPLGVGHVGQPKAPVVAQQLQQISPGSTIRGFVRRIDCPDDLGSLDAHTVLLSLPDNDLARSVSLDAALRAGCLGGTAAVSANHAQVIVQQHACRRCLGLIADESAQGGASCAAAGEPSIVTMNALAAAILVSEMRHALAGENSRNLRYYGSPDHPAGTNRFAQHLTAPPCDHLESARARSSAQNNSIGGRHAQTGVL